MLITKLPKYLKGTVIFEIKADKSEEFLNACAREKLPLFNIKYKKDMLEVTCVVDTYKKIQRLKINGLKRKILSKKGVRFKVYKYRKRSGLVIGCVFMITALITMSGFVWDISVSGNERLSTNVILQTLEECGFKEGIGKSNLDISKIENQMMINLPDLSWISINLDGSFAYVEVKERTMPPVSEDVSRPSNLIAAMDGQIIKMDIVKGKPITMVGSGVVKGELLVAGFYNDKKDNIILEHSSGKVYANCEIKRNFEISLKAKNTVGSEKLIFYTLELFGNNVDLSFGKRPKELEWDRTDTRERLKIFGLEFPVYVIESCYQKDIKQETVLSDNDAKSKIKMEIEHFEKSELFEAEILKKHISWKNDKNTMIAKVSYIVQTDIAKQQYIDTETGNLS